MENIQDFLKSKIDERRIQTNRNEQYKKFDLSSNPFPRSGISDLNSSDEIIFRLEPVDKEVKDELDRYVIDSLFAENMTSPQNKYLSLVIRGNYGYGKTQTLLYVKTYLESFALLKEFNKKPYVIYIENPGAKLTELIGSIISQIGDENFKKYLWNEILEKFKNSTDITNQISELIRGGQPLLTGETNLNPFSAENTINYKKFLDACYNLVTKSNKKQLQDFIEQKATTVLSEIFENSIIATYFHDLLLESAGINKTWESFTTGSIKSFEKKEVYLIKAILKILDWQGFTDFYILVDEFEAVAEGRLSKTALQSYLDNLKALIAKERNWCSVFSMTNQAFERIRTIEAPLSQRISSRIINLKPLNNETAKQLAVNYLNLARDESESIIPFNDSGIDSLRRITKGNHRLFLKGCFTIIQRAVEELESDKQIDKDFVEKYIEEEFE